MDLITTLSFPVDEGTLPGGQARPGSSALGEEPLSGATRAPDQAPYPFCGARADWPLEISRAVDLALA